jgi:hypothetical protein
MIAAGMISAALLILLVVRQRLFQMFEQQYYVAEVQVFMTSTKAGLKLNPSEHLFS